VEVAEAESVAKLCGFRAVSALVVHRTMRGKQTNMAWERKWVSEFFTARTEIQRQGDGRMQRLVMVNGGAQV
jgi:hypothetical protein